MRFALRVSGGRAPKGRSPVRRFIGLDYDGACKLMLRVHHERKAVCGTFEREGAEATVAGILAFAGEHNQPLKCIIEEAR